MTIKRIITDIAISAIMITLTKKYLFIVILCISLCACGDKKKASNTLDIPILKVSDCEQVEDLTKSHPEYFLETKYVKLESTDESILGEITQMEIFEKHIYILDRQGKSLKKFDMNGKYLQNIGKEGLGPEEYVSLNAFYINPERKTINIFDPMKNAVLQYDLYGKYQNTVEVEKNSTVFFRRLSYLNENEIFCYSGTNWRTNCECSILDATKQYAANCLYPYPLKSDKQMSMGIHKHPYSVINNKISFISVFCDTVFSYSNKEIRPRMFIEREKPVADLQTLNKIFSETDGDLISTIRAVGKKGYTMGFNNIFETESFICCDFNDVSQQGNWAHNAIIWNKKTDKGVCLSGYSKSTPDFRLIYYAFDNTFVRIWDEIHIANFNNHLERDIYKREDYDEEIMKLLDTYNAEDDNPILIFYTMK